MHHPASPAGRDVLAHSPFSNQIVQVGAVAVWIKLGLVNELERRHEAREIYWLAS